MNPDKNEENKLPEGWVLCTSKSNPGRKYYFNKKTGKSSWTQPQADDKSGQSKQKSKKPKPSQPDKSKKEEFQKRNLKRKSDSKDDVSVQNKKQKEETRTPEKQQKSVNSKPSPSKLPDPNKKTSPCNVSKTQTPSGKNIANNRLSQLRAQLASECKKEESSMDTSPTKGTKNRISPNSGQTETTNKLQKNDLKSPNSNESKCTTATTHSPSSDSFQSVPSPSQFFAANKIISSMKAQLPEEYCNKAKQKNTFADIEEGICNQTAEYPFMKHPATPPQFSEASKLVSAIKSKLSYKSSVSKDISVQSYSSANDRLTALRTRLSSEAAVETNSSFSSLNDSRDLKPSEDMDVDCREIQKAPAPVQYLKESTETVSSSKDVVLVVDTNVFIHELDFIKDVLNSHIKGYSEQPTLLVPWRVINELDRLKDNNNGNGAICKRAKSAMDYLYKSLPENSRIKGQSLRDANSHIYPCELPDDEILNCCLQQSERGKSVILLSHDKNLCNKALINGVRCTALSELRPLLESKPDLHAGLKRAQDAIYHLLANILENEMRAKYVNLWQRVLFKPPPWSLADVLQCLLKHWVAVFNEVFPRIEDLITDLLNSVNHIQKKDPKSLSQSEVSNFKELCLEVAKKCQIIPEYMELAKQTVDRLARASETAREEQDGEMVVIEAFERLWTVFSSYCAKLSSSLGVPHHIEDRLQGADPLPSLTAQHASFAARLAGLTGAIDGALSTSPSGEVSDQRLAALEAAFRASLALVGADAGPLDRDKLRAFCTKCRNMLQEAHSKFCELTDLLEVCKTKMVTD